ncbi:hypothetical protein JXD38_08785 [candidate division WOR-3 bacterium]|nr:hypothetical protein [candidate division WOR-3 bacterium]
MRITIIVLLLAVTLPALAQDSPEAWLIPFAAAYQPPVNGFNAVFAKPEYGMPQARSRHFGWGIELRTLTGSSLLVGPLFFKTWDDVDNGSYRLRTDATGIFGEAGLRLAPFSFLTIVPTLGVGGLSQSFSLRKNLGDTINIDTLFSNIQGNLSFASGTKLAGMAALELGFAANSSSGRIGVTLRGGYLYSPFRPAWRIANGALISGAPNDCLGGWFFSVGLLLMPQAQTTTELD